MVVKLTSSDVVIRCSCSEIVMKSRGDEEIVRAKVLVIKGKQVFAVCKGCNTEIELPLEKSEERSSDYGPELYLDK